jgi:uncharacterized iron-regulated membrane protein
MLHLKRITVGAVALALAVPAAAGAREDNGPITRDAPVSAAPARSDLRSPDAREAATNPRQAPGVDLRSPDVQDATTRAPAVPADVTPAAPPATSTATSSSFEWGDAVIGAAGMLGIVLLVVGVGMLAVRHRHAADGGIAARPH